MDISALTEAGVIDALQSGAYYFGSEQVRVSSSGAYVQEGTLSASLQSVCSILLIGAGKRVNAFLALFGLRIPKGLTAMIRSRV
jgi:hypothetical protein